jgi:nicotinamidase-related amidase
MSKQVIVGHRLGSPPPAPGRARLSSPHFNETPAGPPRDAGNARTLPLVPVDLHEMLDPEHTAVLTMELQRGVIGDLAMIPELAAEVAAAGVLANAGRVAAAARAAGARVVHCTAQFRADHAGSSDNSPMQRGIAKRPAKMVLGTGDVDLVPELAQAPSDVVVPRHHGLTPFPGTELDQILRNLGVTTVVAAGVSVNIGVLGMVMVAVDLGYRVALVTDAVAGVPKEYADAVIDNTLRLLATCVTTDQVVDTWS